MHHAWYGDQSGKSLENVYTDTFPLQGATRSKVSVPFSILHRKKQVHYCCDTAENLLLDMFRV
jgi:hypothetical protein